jgi:cephalosporin hydroxylase
VIPIVGDDTSEEVYNQLPRDVGILFVDSDHTYELTREEIRLHAWRVRPGGVVAFHDTNVEAFPHHSGDGYAPQPPFPVRQAVDEWIAETGYAFERLENCNGLTVVSVGIPGPVQTVTDLDN